MSWYELFISDIDLAIKPAKISMNWTCPRCLKEQDVIIQAINLLDGQFVTCQNISVCGKGQVYFELSLEIGANGQKGLSDRPLENPVTEKDDWSLFNQEKTT